MENLEIEKDMKAEINISELGSFHELLQVIKKKYFYYKNVDEPEAKRENPRNAKLEKIQLEIRCSRDGKDYCLEDGELVSISHESITWSEFKENPLKIMVEELN